MWRRNSGDGDVEKGRCIMCWHHVAELERGHVRWYRRGISTKENGVTLVLELHGEGGVVRDGGS